ncbi:pyridoxal-phosphate dependent enzyme [Teichococcus aestuarii]|uniref:pyridoxal-phosphate dependent enzyme n=1 Tax=Teichococcus aestuarii TaxID=568898 RepID=UPI00361937FF
MGGSRLPRAGQCHRPLRCRLQRAGLRHRLRRADAGGEIGRLPRIFAAQPENCGPIAREWLGEDAADPIPTIAEGTAIAQPLRRAEVLAVLRESRGGAVLLSETEIVRATRGLARRGLYVEPTCAQAAAAFGRLLEDGTIREEETTVVVLTGSGLKATQRHAELAGVSL